MTEWSLPSLKPELDSALFKCIKRFLSFHGENFYSEMAAHGLSQNQIREQGGGGAHLKDEARLRPVSQRASGTPGVSPWAAGAVAAAGPGQAAPRAHSSWACGQRAWVLTVTQRDPGRMAHVSQRWT